MKPYWGKPAVRNFRGGEGNVSRVWRLFATPPERADTTEADRPKLGAPSLYSVTWRDRLGDLEAVNDARDAVFDQRHVEVDQPAKPLAGETEIRQKLLLVDWGDQLDGFDLDDNLIFDHQMGLESGVDTDILIGHRNRLLAHLPETPAAKFIAACFNFLAKSPSREKARQV